MPYRVCEGKPTLKNKQTETTLHTTGIFVGRMKFITSNATTIARRQRQTRRACEACRRRKRRCNHVLSTDMNVNDISETFNVSTDTRLSPEHRESGSGHGYGTNDPNSQEASEDSSRTSRRFIGDLNPESVFRSATSPATATRGFPSQEGIGTWLVENLKSSENPRESDSHSKPEGIFFTPNASSTTQKLLSSFLEEECFLELPSEIYLSQLLLFYAEKIYPMFPIIDIKFFQSDIEHNSKILLSQAMCLLASTNPQCKGMLYLRGKNDLLPPRLFGYRLFCAMRCIIDIGLISNKIVQIQALGALALFTEGPEGPEAAAQLHGKMIQLVYTLGLHVQSQHDKEEYEVTSLCCAWAIDRLNAAIHGRPVLMHERDMDRDLNKCIHSQSPAFRLLLLVISQLDQVIDLYRPNSKSAETEFNCPAFEDLIVSAQCVNLPAGFLNTIEVLYFAIIILSRRKPSNNRIQQMFAASRITFLVQQEVIGHELIFFLFIPYAVSLSLSISYKQMRYTKVPMYQQRARSEMQLTCDLLDQLSNYFYVASIMANMGKATLAEMDRVSEMILHERNLIEHSQHSQQPQCFNANQPAAPNTSEDVVEHGNMDIELPGNHADFNISDVDIFDMFDPNFGLENVDAVFQSSLDLGTPIYPSVYTERMPHIMPE